MDNDLDLTYERLLGEGSYGKVFLVKQQDGEQFAVKEIDLTKCDEDGKTQALGESAILARIKHDNILRYVESVINDDCLYIITEYCGGGDLEDYLQTVARCNATIPESLVSEWILQLGEALKYLHDQKILHRDMKTKNIFLKDDLTVKLGDMGIAKVLDMNQSKANTFIGTPSYMSPELFSGKSYNHKTDIWGLGCCTYEMMTLKRAFQGKALWTLIREIKQGKELELPDQYSLDIRALVQDMMNQAPEGRPSARDIAQNDLLLYHRGKSKDDITMLPRPNQVILDKKKKSRNSANLSGSFNRMIQDKKRAEDDEFRDTLTQVCAKINTLQSTGSSMVEDVNTFVYHGDDDSDCELEASNTVLDSSRLKQYTQQLDTLDTFVYKGDVDSDSDYSTGGSIKKTPVGNKEEEEEDVDVTLIRQYSSHLEELSEESGGEGAGQAAPPLPHPSPHDREEDSGRGPSPEPELPKPEPTKPEQVKSPGPGRYKKHAPSPKMSMAPKHISPSKTKPEPNLEDSEDFTSKYKYLGLRDTLALRPDKRWKRHSETDALLDRLKGTKISEDDTISEDVSGHDQAVKKRSEHRTKSGGSHRPFSMSSSLSSTGTFGGTRTKVSDTRLNKTLSFGDSDAKPRQTKVRISDKIEQSARSKAEQEIHLRSPKKAFAEPAPDHDNSYTLTSPDQVKDVVTHLRGNLTPYTEDKQPELTDTIKSAGSDDGKQDPSKGKKKKVSLLKKQSNARKKSVESEPSKEIDVIQEGETNIKLFTRAQTASFSKDDDDSETHGQTNGRQKHQDLNSLLTQLRNSSSETLANEQILNIQRELTSGIGLDNLSKVLDIMSMVTNEEEMQLHVKNLVGHRLFEEYQQHLVILRYLEMRGRASPTPT